MPRRPCRVHSNIYNIIMSLFIILASANENIFLQIILANYDLIHNNGLVVHPIRVYK